MTRKLYCSELLYDVGLLFEKMGGQRDCLCHGRHNADNWLQAAHKKAYRPRLSSPQTKEMSPDYCQIASHRPSCGRVRAAAFKQSL